MTMLCDSIEPNDNRALEFMPLGNARYRFQGLLVDAKVIAHYGHLGPSSPWLSMLSTGLSCTVTTLQANVTIVTQK